MKNKLITFRGWERLFESSQRDITDVVHDVVGDRLGNLHVVPDFPAYAAQERGIDPLVVLFSNDEPVSFAVNFKDGRAHSVDVWTGTNPRPRTTPVETDLDSALESALSVREAVDDAPDDGYVYSDPDTIFDDLSIYVDMVIEGIQPSLLLTGTTGTGKSKTVQNRLDAAGKVAEKDYVIIKGKSTAIGIYTALYENNGKLVIFDDCDSVFKDQDGVLVLMGALESERVRTISWRVGTPIKGVNDEVIPKKFQFTGGVIFISNIPMKKMPDPLKGRSFNLEVAITPKDMLRLLEKKLKAVEPDEPLGLKKVALSTIKLIAAKNPDVKINFRTLIKSIKILKYVDDLGVAKRMIVQQCSYK